MNNNFIKTKKYKTVSLYLYFASSYSFKKYLCLNLLTFFIGDYSTKYPTKVKMTFAKDKLYGANIYTSCKAKAGIVYFAFKYSFLNPYFAGLNENEFIVFFKEVLYHTYFSEELLEEFKKIYKDNIKRSLDKPNNYANNKVNKLIANKDNSFEIYCIDNIDLVDNINLDDVISVYNELLNRFRIDVYLIGDYSNDLLSYAKSLIRKNEYYFTNKMIDIEEVGEIIENKNISQSSLQLVYKTSFNRSSSDYYAYILGNAVFGITPTSLLFEQIREKLSLCYYISLYDYKNEGIIKIYTSIEGKNKDKVIEQIDVQLRRMIDKEYDPLKIDSARALLIDSIMALQDNVDNYVEYYYMNSLNGLNCSRQEYIEKLNKVTIEDIASVFNKYEHVLTYMLNGVKNEKDS